MIVTLASCRDTEDRVAPKAGLFYSPHRTTVPDQKPGSGGCQPRQAPKDKVRTMDFVRVGAKIVTKLKEFTGYLPNPAAISAQSTAVGFDAYTPAPAPPSPEAFSNRLNSQANTSLQEIRSRLFAVHATDVFPEDGKLRAGAMSKSGAADPPSFRPTVHFALGELVREHGHSSWDSRRYAIVAPLQQLEPQLANVMTHDTFVLGDLQLQKGSVLLAPEGAPVGKLPEGIEVRRYSPELGLRDSVDQAIRDKGGWNIKMESGTAAMNGQAKLGEQSVNHPQFFAELFQAKPGLSFGDHLASQVGEAGRFGAVEQCVISLTQGIENASPFSTGDLRVYRAAIAHHLPRIEQLSQDYPAESQQAVADKIKSLRGWLNVADVDLAAREHWGKTLHCAPKEIRREIVAQRADLEQVRQAFQKHRGQLPSVDDSGPPKANLAAEALHTLPLAEFEGFLAQRPDLFEKEQIGAVKVEYLLQRMLRLGPQISEQEKLLPALAKALPEFRNEYLGQDSLYSSDILRAFSVPGQQKQVAEIVATPGMLGYLNHQYGFDFGPTSHPPQNLDQLIAAHPTARLATETFAPEFSGPQRKAFELLQRLELVSSDSGPRNPKTFSEAYGIGNNRERELARLPNDTLEMLSPLDAPIPESEIGKDLTVYQSLKRAGKLESAMQDLQLKAEFQQIYGSEDKFWQSKDSLVVAVERMDQLKAAQQSVSTMDYLIR